MPLSELPPPIVAPDEQLGMQRPQMRVAPPGPMSRAWAQRLAKVECPVVFDDQGAKTQETLPIVYASTYGCNVVDVDGNLYVDFAAGFGAMLLGHGSQRVARSLESQAERAWMGLGDLYPTDSKVALLERLVGLFPQGPAKALLGQSGSDAITIALKTAMLKTGKPGIVAFDGAYHGLGYGPLAACGVRPSFRAPFAPQLNPFVQFAPYPHAAVSAEESLQVVKKALGSGQIGAILVEPVLGRGGCIVPPTGWLGELSKLAADHGCLLIADEIWTALGRTGAMLACSREGVVPDIICLGKGLGGGLPISACVGKADVMDAWRLTPGVVHTSTFQGHALAAATAIATLDSVRTKRLADRAGSVGQAFVDSLRNAFASVPAVREVTGVGLMVGVHFLSPDIALAANKGLLEAGYITVLGGRTGDMLTLTPPLTIEQNLLDGFVDDAVRVFRAL